MSSTSKKRHFAKMHPDFAEKYPFLFNKCCETKDIETMEYMINMFKNVQENKITEHVASVNVGQKLYNDYVKPVVDVDSALGK